MMVVDGGGGAERGSAIWCCAGVAGDCVVVVVVPRRCCRRRGSCRVAAELGRCSGTAALVRSGVRLGACRVFRGVRVVVLRVR